MSDSGLIIKVLIGTAHAPGWTETDWEPLKRLTEDQASIQAANLAYGLVERAWGHVIEEEEK